ITDKDHRAIIVLAGTPRDEGWSHVVTQASEFLVSLREEGIRTSAFPEDFFSHRRGEFIAIACGVSHGTRRTRPGNLQHPPERQTLVSAMLDNEFIRRIAGFQSSAFSYFAPKLYAHYCKKLLCLFKRDQKLQRNFEGSIFPGVSVNLGPTTVALDHTDAGNVAYGLCALTPLGSFDDSKGGYLILFDLGLLIQFPAGSVILLPSGVLRHGNTPILAGEERMSIAQYCAGGLLRWVDYGFKQAKRLSKKQKLVVDGDHNERVQEALSLFSRVDELEADRRSTFCTFKTFLRSFF
ncbi:hypothetical protein BDN72DRAFT_778995, partial [Pluteus cervinus]